MKKQFLLLTLSLAVNAANNNNNNGTDSFQTKRSFKHLLFKLRALERMHESDYAYGLPTQQQANNLWENILLCTSQSRKYHYETCFQARHQLKFMELVAQKYKFHQEEILLLQSYIQRIDTNIINPNPERNIIPWKEEDVLTEYALLTGEPDKYKSVLALAVRDKIYLDTINTCQNRWGGQEICQSPLKNLRLSQRNIDEKFKCSEGLPAPRGPLSESERKRYTTCQFFWKVKMTCSNIILQQELSCFVSSVEEDK